MRLLLLLLAVLLAACPPTLGDDDDAADDDDASDDDDAADDDDVSDDDDVADDDDDDDGTPCGVADLLLRVEAQDSNGVQQAVFGAGESVTLVGQLSNICPFDVAFETSSGCLLEPWTLTNSSGAGEGRGCDDAITPWNLGEEAMLFDIVEMGTMSPGAWTFTAGFLGGQSDTITFEVVAPPS
ncbi:MAG: hypothetical protein KDA24_29805 [Deltaproteobacteria bacterium]|nr:hypothetical protein [Deltaproteobacteria bacterium]